MKFVIVKEHFFSIGVSVLLLMTVYFALEFFHHSPARDDFLPAGRTDFEQLAPDQRSEVRSQFDHARERHDAQRGYVYLPLGLGMLVLGSFWIATEVLATACVFSGFLLMVAGLVVGWNGPGLKFCASLMTLAAVVFVTRRKFGAGQDSSS